MSVSTKDFYRASIYTSAALETYSQITSPIVSSSPNIAVESWRLLGFIADNYSASAGWFQVFNLNAAPSAGAIPICSLRVGATSQISLDANCFNFMAVGSSGIVIALSSTGPTYTPVTNQQFITAWFIA